MTDTAIAPPDGTAPASTSGPALDAASGARWRTLRRRPLFLLTGGCVLLLLLVAAAPGLFAGWFGHGNPTVCDLGHSAEGPAPGHPFGYDVQGCDLYANVIHGAGASLGVGLLATGCGLAVALVLGCLAGMAGRVVDSVIARITDVFLGFPFLLGAIVVLNSVTTRDVPTVAGVLALFGWPTMTRVVRASVRSVREADYVVMSRSLGASQWHIVVRHVLPNALTPVLVLASITVGGVIVAESALTFLGVGLQPPSISWGLQLAGAQNSFQTHPHLLIFPGLFLCFTVFVLITFGDIVRDALDPRGR
ncbi:ABC transporter permease [Streptomyces pseudovenezuelae]|uniref:Oligopeptide transport system permease protein n=1 Tax=Streptomyces pseudovenezuelae TaxID=67350 RepID=A0ABT6LCL7_9ACTN|nr:ABC transporter permease [Streptomyces pseudovenezuelae]MDH6214056.1 oligopeptide transport system permease protein [Streptomyces pseudovenezuelae]